MKLVKAEKHASSLRSNLRRYVNLEARNELCGLDDDNSAYLEKTLEDFKKLAKALDYKVKKRK